MSKISTDKPNCSTQRKKEITTLNSLLQELVSISRKRKYVYVYKIKGK